MGNALIANVEDFARLSPGRDFQLFVAIQSRDFDLGTQRRLRDVDIEVQDNIVLTPLEKLMGCHVQDEEQASIGSAVGTGSALPCQADLRPAIHTRRDLHLLPDSLTLQPTGMTGLAGR